MEKKKIKAAVVGVGSLGRHHARIYSELDQVELVGVSDLNMEQAKDIASKHHCEVFPDLASLSGKVDVASVVVPTKAHCQVAKNLLENGIDILLEKPMTSTVEEADQVLALAEKTGRILQVGHIEQFNSGVKKLKESLTQAHFIECHRMGPFATRGTDVHVILDLMIHDIDIILSLVPSEIVEIRAVGVPVLTPQIDIANVRLAFENGCVANVTASRVSMEKLRKIRIFQADSYLSLDYMNQELIVGKRIFREGEIPKVSVDKIKVEKEEPLKSEIEAFIHAVQTRSVPKVSGEAGRKALEVSLRIVELIQKER
ncbi:MAG TPA: Gfo/Idh/MocA family oxidoreductase [Nitrospiria bacterium]|nr:Gfo/Idh/MocA family oxidoreductase [Candidatus Manganitrophaceae bacterium]HIL35543.1 Gfo/Idh/MocA family oxidoreductase [Candidatus Manganitrophaceae bacterium]